MLIQVLRQTMLAGRVVRVGDVIEASPDDARLLIGIGKAEQFTEAPVKEPVKTTPTTSRRRKPQ
jgi:hypothetical protein